MQMVASGACNSIIFEKISSKNTMNHDQQIYWVLLYLTLVEALRDLFVVLYACSPRASCQIDSVNSGRECNAIFMLRQFICVTFMQLNWSQPWSLIIDLFNHHVEPCQQILTTYFVLPSFQKNMSRFKARIVFFLTEGVQFFGLCALSNALGRVWLFLPLRSDFPMLSQVRLCWMSSWSKIVLCRC
jgi:hypothetical protein